MIQILDENDRVELEEKIEDILFNQEETYPVVSSSTYQTITGYCMSGTDEVDGRATKLLIESSSVGKKIVVLPVNAGEKYKVSGQSYYGLYNAVALVLSDTYWDFSTFTTSSRISIIGKDYSIFGGVTAKSWTTFSDYEIAVPSGAKYLYVLGDNPVIKKLTFNKISKIPTKVSQLENDTLIDKTIFSLPDPTVTTGVVSKQTLHALHSKNVSLWTFSDTGSIDFGEITIPYKSTDTIGLWVYCNETMLSVPGNTDGTMHVYINGVKKAEYNAGYKFRVGWNYLPIEVDSKTFKLKIMFTLVRGTYEFAVDSIELNYEPKVKPKILLSFDMGSETMYTNRHLLLKEYGFRATYCNVWGISDDKRNEMFAYGDDWAIYGNDTSSDTTYPGNTATVEQFEEYLQKTVDRAESIGLFNPVSYFSPNNAGFPNLMQALINKGFKIGRTAVSGQYNIDYFGKDSFYINTYGVGGEETSTNVLKAIDDAINSGNSICVFTHDVLENPTDNMNAKKSTYVEILNGIKQRVDSGKCEVCTFTDFYREWMPNECASYLENRHEKEKQYILNKINN